MRSIGKIKIKKLIKIAEEVVKSSSRFSYTGDVKKKVLDQIPGEWYDTWECAASEIDRLVGDAVSKLMYERDCGDMSNRSDRPGSMGYGNE